MINRKNWLSKLMVITGLCLVSGLMVAHAAGDPSGTNLMADWSKVNAKNPGEVVKGLVNVKVGLNMTWVLITGFLVFFMQAGFALVETGFCRAKNSAHTMMMNLVVFCVSLVGFYLVGFGFMFGGYGVPGPTKFAAATANLGDFGVLNGMFHIGNIDLLGTTGFALSGSSYDASVMTLFLFQLVFMDTAATIPTGSTSERIQWRGFLLMSLWVSMLVYPLIGCWVWGGGWLADTGKLFGWGHGAVDFSGSGVVHMVGGSIALAGALVIGPRVGKYGRDGSVNAIPGHNLPLAALGVIILFFGWFGFNAGSTLGATDLRIASAAVATMIAGGFGGFAAMFRMWIFEGKPDPGYIMNGVLAGLVAITSSCAFVSPTQAAIIGILAGGWVCDAGLFIERKLKIDDPVGAIAVHFCNGAFGVVCVGIFADGTYGNGWNGVDGPVKGILMGDVGQLIAQLAECTAILVVAFGFSYVFFTLLKSIGWLRVSPQVELDGLDVEEMGIWGYPDPEASFAPPTTGQPTFQPQQQQQE